MPLRLVVLALAVAAPLDLLGHARGGARNSVGLCRRQRFSLGLSVPLRLLPTLVQV